MESSGFISVNVTRSYEQVVQQIQDRVRSGALARGQKLPTERELSESFGVSRSVIREALKILEATGLVESRQGSGTYVRDNLIPSISRALTLSVTAEEQSLLRLLEFREELDALSARLAAQRRTAVQSEAIQQRAAETGGTKDFAMFGPADARFHDAIDEAAGNPYLAAVVRALRQMQSSVVELITEHPGSIAIAAEHHYAIAEAIAVGAPDEAARLMAVHVHYVTELVQGIMATSAEESKDALARQVFGGR